MKFTDKAFIVTGGGSGIGRGIVKRLAEEGARVMILDVDAHGGADAVEEYGDRVRFTKGSVASEPVVRRCVAATVKWVGQLDGIVNNAGIADPVIGPLEDLPLTTWQKFIDVNLTGTFLVAKHAVPHLREANGAIVNISSSRAVMSEPHTEPDLARARCPRELHQPRLDRDRRAQGARSAQEAEADEQRQRATSGRACRRAG